MKKQKRFTDEHLVRALTKRVSKDLVNPAWARNCPVKFTTTLGKLT